MPLNPGEVIFSLAGEILLLNGALPNLTGGIGIIIILVGIIGYSMRTWLIYMIIISCNIYSV